MKYSYLPHTGADRKAMLQTIGVKQIKDLFTDIPESLLLKQDLDLPASMSEQKLAGYMRDLANKNANLLDYACFLGAGAYDHYQPSAVDHVLSRSEFYTAYTQYQPELSQGYLQALWEYQSMICTITGMDVSNASMYDGASAMAEAAIMACNSLNRTEVLVAKTVHPLYRELLNTYAVDLKLDIQELDYRNGLTSQENLSARLTKQTAAVIIQSPNFFGCIEDLQAFAQMVHAQGALLIAVVDPISLAVLKPPGELGADIVVGEGQALGLPLAFGGPYLGFLATTTKLMRKLPGRIVGQTVDTEGQRGFVLTIQAREQHIRREKATSNICSNQALCALAASVYLSTVGKEGYRQIAEHCLHKSHYAQQSIVERGLAKLVFDAPYFKEFVVQFNRPIAQINQQLFNEKIIGGLDLEVYYPELKNCMLLCVTEQRSKQEIDKLIATLEVRS